MIQRRAYITAVILAAAPCLLLLLWLLLQWRPDTAAWPRWPESSRVEPAADPGAVPAVAVTWLGTSTLLFSDGDNTLLTDAYFSRVSRLATISRRLSPDEARIDAMLERYRIGALDAVLVVHSHFDHALDSASVALRTGAELVGSESTANLGRGAGMAESAIRIVTSGEAIRYGQFEVLFLRSGHVPQSALVDRLTGLGEAITEPVTPPAPVGAWKEGESYALLIRHPAATVLIQGSAGFVEGQLDGHAADIAFVASAGLFRQRDGYVADYVRNTVTATGAKQVVPIHWDDFFQPWQGAATPPLPRAMENLEQSFTLLAREARRSGAGFVLLRPGQTIQLPRDFPLPAN